MEKAKPTKLALFASGNGTNVQRICEYFRGNERIRPAVLFCDRPRAFVLERARQLGLPTVPIDKAKLSDPEFMLKALHAHEATHIVLAGFLAKIPGFLVQAYSGHIYNVHPALLPKFGGKGMYGMHVHEAVLAAREKESGITIHLVDEHYDQGKILFQASCPVAPDDTASDLAEKIHRLEQEHFPLVLERFIGATPFEQNTQTL